MKNNWMIATILMLSCFMARAAGDAFFFQQDLFHEGDAGVASYRIPALVETRGGVLLAVADARRDGSHDLPGHISLVMRRSYNQGRDWEPARTIQAVEQGGVGDASLLLDRSNGRVWCFFAYGPPGIGFRNAQPGALTGPTTLQIHAIHSDDEGMTWSDAVDLTPQIKDRSWQAMFATSGTNVQTGTGRFLVPLVVRDGQGLVHSVNAYSDDHGTTWKTGKLIGVGTDESHPVELAGGEILQNMRFGTTRVVARSQDGGVTFGPVTGDPALIDPKCNAGITRGRSGGRDVLIFTNAASTKRENLTVKLSYDGGRTWPVARLIQDGPSAYSTVVVLKDGSIGVFYEHGGKDADERMTFARFSLPWVR